MTSLSLLQMVSPALPVGAFSYSEGLEVLIQSGALSDEHGIEQWMVAELQRGALRFEAAALPVLAVDLRCWHRSADSVARSRVIDLDGWLLAMREAVEVRAQQLQMGGSLLELLAEMGHPLPDVLPLAWPAAWAWASVALQVAERPMVEGYLYGWVVNQLSAAVRLVPLGPTRAQVLQQRLSSQIVDLAEHLSGVHPQEMWSGGVGASMAQLAHAELYSRLFRS